MYYDNIAEVNSVKTTYNKLRYKYNIVEFFKNFAVLYVLYAFTLF